VNDLEGKPVDLGQYIGKRPVFLEFWATWCEQCEALLPRLRAAQATYGSQVEFIGVNVTVNQSPERVRKYLQTHQPGFLPLYDDQGTSIRAFQVPATSYVVILDRAGKVVYTGTGGSQQFDGVLRQVTRN
jgi:thiol-disulfide isomerase/thioredoxin